MGLDNNKNSASASLVPENSWISKIKEWQKDDDMQKWREACKKIRNMYRYERSARIGTRQYALLWSNIQTLKGVIYAKPPKADISRRFLDKDATARVACIMLERCVNFTLETENYDAVFCKVRDDYLLEGRGIARVIYEPVLEDVDDDDDTLDGADVEGVEKEEDYEDEAAEEPEQILKFERVKLEYVHPEDFVTDPARIWEEVECVAFRSFLTRKQLVRRFGDKVGNAIVLGDNRREEDSNFPKDFAEDKAVIWEVWDKPNDRVLWVSPGYPKILEESEPYLKFEHFFPCPRPAYGTMTSDTLAPRPDYIFYQDQAEEINTLTARIAALQDSLKLVGFYPAGPKGEGVPEIERAFRPGFENKMIAVPGWENFTTKGGGKVPVVFLPVEEVASTLESCINLRKQLIDDVNQIYGIADIMRGQGDANETATAQQIKGNYGSIRLRDRQMELSRFCRDVTRLVAEVIANHFEPDTLMSMANMPLPTDESVQQQMIMARLQAQMQLPQQVQPQQPPQQTMGMVR